MKHLRDIPLKNYCTYRIGSRSYCSRPFGDSFFFGGDASFTPVSSST